MLLEVINTTDGRHIGHRFDNTDRAIRLSSDEWFAPDRTWLIAPNMWRLANSNYILDAKEVHNG